MFLENKYTSLYFKLTSKSDSCEYSENHHIIPKCMGGSDDQSNLIRLSARKHFLCHYLLIKMIDRGPAFYKLIHAFSNMRCANRYQPRYFNSRLYENHRKDFSKAMSLSQAESGNSQFGTSWVYCPMTLVSRKVPKNELDSYIEKGCVKGRIVNSIKFVERNQNIMFNSKSYSSVKAKQSSVERQKKRKEKEVKNKEYAFETFKKFKESELSQTDYANLHFPLSRPSMIALFKKYNLL